MTKVKICGITNLEDALLSVKFGADALGFNFYEKSPRYIAPEKARDICAKLPPEIFKVGVFVNETLDKIIEIAEYVSLNAIQLHGDESVEFVRDIKEKFKGEVIKALRVSENFQPEDVLQFNADAILLDAFSKQEYGGTGETFNWEIAKKVKEIFPKMYLAGGLSNNNIDYALRQTHPFAVDACSCVEQEKGKKNKISLINFITKVSHFDWWHKISQIENFKINNIYEYLNLIHLRPAMYIGAKTLTGFGHFVTGFREGLRLTQNDFDWKRFHTFEFHDFIKMKLDKLGFGGANGFNINLYECDEEEAFDQFFALLEEFKLEKEDLSNE